MTVRKLVFILGVFFGPASAAHAGCSESLTPITTGWDLTGKVQGELRPIGRYDAATFDATDGQQLCVRSTLEGQTRVHQFKCDEGRLEFVQRVSSEKSAECHKVVEGVLRIIEPKVPVEQWLKQNRR